MIAKPPERDSKLTVYRSGPPRVVRSVRKAARFAQYIRNAPVLSKRLERNHYGELKIDLSFRFGGRGGPM